MWLVAALFALSVVFIGCGGGGGDSAPAATVPAAPSSLIANAGDNTVTLSWSPVAGATSYNSYRGTAPGVTKATGTKVSGVQSPNVVAGLTNGTPYYFVVTAVGAGGESAESDEVSATPVAAGTGFSQSDLTGTWDIIMFGIGSSERGWQRAGANVAGSGAITATYYLDSNGGTGLPPPGSITWTMSSAGVVTEGGASGDPAFHGQMSSNKLLVIGKKGAGGTSAGVSVFRKRTGTTFTSADLANKTFTYHQLLSGADNTWERGAGTTNASSAVTLTSIVTPSGNQPLPPGEVGTLAVNSAGIVTDSVDNTWYGLMTDDKKVVFVIQTSETGVYGFMVITITGQTYTQADYAGIYNFSGIRNTVPNPGWAYGVTSIDAAGTGTYLSYTDSGGGATPANYTRVLSSSGVVTDPADSTFHGQLSHNKDISVRTNTNASGRYGLTIGFK